MRVEDDSILFIYFIKCKNCYILVICKFSKFINFQKNNNKLKI